MQVPWRGHCRLPTPGQGGLRAEAPWAVQGLPCGRPYPAPFRAQFQPCTGLELQANCELGAPVRQQNWLNAALSSRQTCILIVGTY